MSEIHHIYRSLTRFIIHRIVIPLLYRLFVTNVITTDMLLNYTDLDLFYLLKMVGFITFKQLQALSLTLFSVSSMISALLHGTWTPHLKVLQ